MKKNSLLEDITIIVATWMLTVVLTVCIFYASKFFTKDGLEIPTPLYEGYAVELPSGEYDIIDAVFERIDNEETEYSYKVDGQMYSRSELRLLTWDKFLKEFNKLNKDMDTIKKKLGIKEYEPKTR